LLAEEAALWHPSVASLRAEASAKE
jgi:hypothetical protein